MSNRKQIAGKACKTVVSTTIYAQMNHLIHAHPASPAQEISHAILRQKTTATIMSEINAMNLTNFKRNKREVKYVLQDSEKNFPHTFSVFSAVESSGGNIITAGLEHPQ